MGRFGPCIEFEFERLCVFAIVAHLWRRFLLYDSRCTHGIFYCMHILEDTISDLQIDVCLWSIRSKGRRLWSCKNEITLSSVVLRSFRKNTTKPFNLKNMVQSLKAKWESRTSRSVPISLACFMSRKHHLRTSASTRRGT